MTLDEIEVALTNHLKTLASVPSITYANKSVKFNKPYLSTLHTPVSRIDHTIDCSIEADKIGIFLVTVVTNKNTFSTLANSWAELVSMHFKQGKKLSAGSGEILITRSEPVGGFHDQNGDWNVPVRITYESEA